MRTAALSLPLLIALPWACSESIQGDGTSETDVIVGGQGGDPNETGNNPGSGGETMGEALLAWGREVFGLTINEFYGQTEVNLVLGNCTDVMPVRAGSMGRPVPGHDVAIVDEEGNPVQLYSGVNDDLEIMSGELYLNDNNGTLITSSEFNSYAENFADENNIGFSGLFLGKNIIQEQLNLSGVEYLRILTFERIPWRQ